MKILKYILILLITNATAQINFSEGNVLIDDTFSSSDITNIITSDLNNDGFKEVIVSSHYDNMVVFYENIEGDIQYTQRHILFRNLPANFYTTYDVFSSDIDNDGLKDIIVTSEYEDKLFWYQNLGNFNFSSLNIVSNGLNRPTSVVADDIDNDGDNDLIVGVYNDENVSLFYNDGSGNFSNQQIIHNSNYGIKKVKLFDLDNDGFLDVITKHTSSSIYWVKNIDGTNFSEPMYISGSAGDGTGFDFIDINSDSYFDIIFTDTYGDKIRYCINQEGLSFDNNYNFFLNIDVSDPWGLLTIDMNGDGLQDVVFSTFTNDQIGWCKNLNSGNFSSEIPIFNNLSNPKAFVAENWDSDNEIELFTSSSDNKLSYLDYNPETNLYDENIISFSFGAANVTRIGDLNNDGHNDIVSGFHQIIWHENYGNEEFSSHKLIDDFPHSEYQPLIYYLELYDFNNDGYLDIIHNGGGVKIYRNNGDETFDLVYYNTDAYGRELELSDLDNDGDLDFLLSYTGENDSPMFKVINNGDFSFEPPIVINFDLPSYWRPRSIKCGDTDGDGDNDIVVSSSGYFKIEHLENDGNGNFTYSLIDSSTPTGYIDLADLDNDGDLDLISGGKDSHASGDTEFYWMENINGEFVNRFVIDGQSLESVTTGDVNNDGFIDIIATSYQYFFQDDKIMCYLNNEDTTFNEIIVESLGGYTGNLTRNASLGDLNNDNKLDLVSTYYQNGILKYFMNTSTLSVDEFNYSKENFKTFPNPCTHMLNWDTNFNLERVEVYNLFGKKVLSKDIDDSNNTLNTSKLSNGLYLFKGFSQNSTYSTKFIKF